MRTNAKTPTLQAAICAFATLFVSPNNVAAQTIPPDNPNQQARAAFDSAERAAANMQFAEALAAYDKALQLAPSAPFARVARTRAADLKAHAEGDFAPLTRLEAIRRNPSAPRADIEALARDAEAFPPGLVRAEAQLVAAEAFWHRFGAPDLAAHALDVALSDPAADRLTRALALGALVALERERGDLQAAYRVVSRYPDLTPSLHEQIVRLVRREWIGRVCMVLLGIVALIGLGAFARVIASRRRDAEDVIRDVVPTSSVAFALYIGGAASILVRIHGEGDVRPFLWLGFGVLFVDIAARAWRFGFVDERARARILRGITCGAAVLAVAFLSLQYADATYLESLGL